MLPPKLFALIILLLSFTNQQSVGQDINSVEVDSKSSENEALKLLPKGARPIGGPLFPPPSEADLREFEYLIAGMKAAREAISAAVVTYTGQRKATNEGEPSASIDGRIEGLRAFDTKRRRLRIEHNMPAVFGRDIGERELKTLTESGKLKEALGGPYSQVNQYLMFVQNETYSALYSKNGKHDSNLNIGTPDWPLVERRNDLHLIDFRSLGMIDLQDHSGWQPFFLYYGSNYELDANSLLCPLDNVINNLSVRRYFRLVKESGLVTIDWGKHSMTIDEHNGFTPVEYRTMQPYWDIYKCSYSAKTSWAEQSGHWVPVTAVLEMNDEQGKKQERFELNLAWSKINANLPDQLFQYESFKNVENETAVIDTRPGAGGILGDWIDGKLQNKFDTQPPAPRSSLLIIIGSLSLFSILLLLLIRTRSRLHSTNENGSDTDS